MPSTFEENYLASAKRQFAQYRSLGEKAIEQVAENKLDWQFNEETNSIISIVKHLSGNMLSRFTDFLTTDGEKKWRNRDAEFENETPDKSLLLKRWNDGWNCLMNALYSIQPEQLSLIILIRNEEHTVMEAINRQLTHYSYHVGQIIFLGKMICGKEWKTLTIPKNASASFNASKGIK